MRVKMLIELGHGPFGQWPKVGEVGEVPEPHASHAIENGYAVPAGADGAKPESADSDPVAETAEQKPKRRR